MNRWLVSACLAGLRCRYDGGSKPHPKVIELVRNGGAVPVCPEMLGGLPIPRPRSELVGGEGRDVLAGRARVVDEEGRDVTGAFTRGARETLRLARLAGVTRAIFKARSPSCGCGSIYDGSFSGRMRKGDGVATSLLKANGIEVVSEEWEGMRS